MYETENDLGIPSPKIQPYESSLQKALKYFREPIDYNSCGNNLRIALEEFFRTFIPSKYFINDKNEQIQATSLTLDPLLVKAREYFNYVSFDTTPLDKLDRYRVRSLNPSSHYNPKTEYFKKELLEIFSILDSLKKNKNGSVVAKDKKINFEIKTQSGKSFIYTAILLDNICLYQKSDGSASFYKDSDERAYAMIGFTEDNTSTTILTHEINRCNLQTLYADTVTYINRSQVAIVETDIYKFFSDENGNTLEQLKNKY
jgi:hypothetical protein